MVAQACGYTKTTELHIFKEWTLWYVDYLQIKDEWHSFEQHLIL
jgi:hypothetical protein